MTLPALLSALLLACTEPDASPKDTPRRCNGAEALCDRPFPDVLFPATHNSMSSAEDGFSLPNQDVNVAAQLADGVRGINLDVYPAEDGSSALWTCHAYCSLGATPFADQLAAIRAFLDAHPDEVLHLMLEDAAPVEAIAAEVEASGLVPSLLVPDPSWDTDGWPTLGALLDSGGRVLLSREGSGGAPPPWLLPQWGVMEDTPYSFSDPAELADDASCAPNRGPEGAPFFLLNHFITHISGDPEDAALVNTADALRDRIDRCTALRRAPSVVMVDFYTRGALLEVVRSYNTDSAY